MTLRRPVLACLLLAAAARAAPLPSPDAIAELADTDDWPALLQATTRALALKGPAARPYDRADLWTKRAEAQMHLNQFIPASQSMEKAAEEKSATADRRDAALALAVLFRKTDAKGYKSSGRLGAIKTYDVLDPAGRTAALDALFKASHAEVFDEVNSAKAATEPKALAALAKRVNDLRPLDRVVNKSNDAADALERTMVGHLVDAAKKWAVPADKRLSELAALGDENVETRDVDPLGHVTTGGYRRGNVPAEVGEAKAFRKQAAVYADAYHALDPVLGVVGHEAIKALVDVVDPVSVKADAVVRSANRH